MLRESLGLTDAGMRNFKRGVFFCALANLVLMAPLCVLFLLVAAFFDHLVAGAPLPDLAPYAAGCVAVVAVVAVTQALEYRFTYGPVYQESTAQAGGHRRASAPAAAFLLRQARPVRPDEHHHEGLRRPGAHVHARDAAAVRHGHIHAGDGGGHRRLRLAAGHRGVLAGAGGVRHLRRGQAGRCAARWRRRRNARLAMADGVQEYLDCAQEIRATNQERAFLRRWAASWTTSSGRRWPRNF